MTEVEQPAQNGEIPFPDEDEHNKSRPADIEQVIKIILSFYSLFYFNVDLINFLFNLISKHKTGYERNGKT